MSRFWLSIALVGLLLKAAVNAHLQWLTMGFEKTTRFGSLTVYNAHGGQEIDDDSASTDLDDIPLVEGQDKQPSSSTHPPSSAQPSLPTEPASPTQPAPPTSWLSGLCGECDAEDDADYMSMFVQPHHRFIMRRIPEDEEQGPQQSDLDWLYGFFCLR